jgi:hypothetical protein
MSSQTQIPVSWCAVILPFVVSPAFLVFVWPSTKYSLCGLICLELIQSCLHWVNFGNRDILTFQVWSSSREAITTPW